MHSVIVRRVQEWTRKRRAVTGRISLWLEKERKGNHMDDLTE